jgi:hypothetical protein
LGREVALKLNMNWRHPDQYFFLCLAVSLATFLAPSIIDELTSTIGELFDRRRKWPVVEPRRSTVNEKAVAPPLPPKHPPSHPKYLKKARPLDGLQRDRPQAAEQFSRLCGSIEDLPPKEQASRLREHFGMLGGARPPERLNKRPRNR